MQKTSRERTPRRVPPGAGGGNMVRRAEASRHTKESVREKIGKFCFSIDKLFLNIILK